MRLLYSFITVSLAAVGIISASPPDSQPAVEVSSGAIEEVRTELPLAPTTGKTYFPDGGWVWLKLQGQSVQSATTYLNLRIDQAVDERGFELIPPYDTRLKPVDRSVFLVKNAANGTPAILVPIFLPKTPRTSQSIAHLRGSVDIRVGAEPFVAVFRQLKTTLGQPLNDPSLAALGNLNMQVLRPPYQADNAVRLSANADAVMLSDVEVCDADGSVLGRARPRRGIPSEGFIADIQLPRAVDDAMSLRVSAYRKTVLTVVTFNLTGIALP